GYPDGSVIDAEGCLWIALYAGWGVRRYDPSGRLMSTVRFPVANVTKIAFGGADLATAYATTARKGLDSAALEAQPHAGDLFAFDPGVAGLPVVPAKI
ncbi:MAG: SMP-30/gluconolactonase/LRE family protein, partial [Blastomonas sp.]|nr:SMP-30/gluconolactonase/LRE family protein [Blastomonas sp.]